LLQFFALLLRWFIGFSLLNQTAYRLTMPHFLTIRNPNVAHARVPLNQDRYRYFAGSQNHFRQKLRETRFHLRTNH
jgi:hypothetical protein